MANSGTQTHRFGFNDGIAYVIFNWERTNYSITNNTSVIEWNVQIKTENTRIDFINPNQPYTVVVDGVTWSGNVNLNTKEDATRTILSGSKNIKHNADGTKTFSYSVAIRFGVYENKGVSSTATIDAIPRKAAIISVSDFTDEENPTITYSNPSGLITTSLMACIADVPTSGSATEIIPYRNISKTGNQYTFELTDEERYLLRKHVKKGHTEAVRFYVRSVVDGVTYHDFLVAIIKLVDYLPVLNPLAEADSRTKVLTGDGSGKTVIRYFSDVTFNTRAVAVKAADIEYQTITCGDVTLDDYTSNTGTITDISSNTIYFSVTDTRGNTTRKAVVFSQDNGKFIPYVRLTNNIATGLLSANGDLTFTISGKYYGGSFGIKKNSLEVEYMLLDENGDPVFNKNGSGWVVLGTVTPTVYGEDYSFSHTITGLDYRGTYTLTVNAIDELTPVQTATKIIASIPVFDWSKEDFSHRTNVYLDNNKTLRSYQADGTDVQILGVNSSDDLVIGWGGYDTSKGDTAVYGNNVAINTNEKFLINGREYGSNKILWEGQYYMHATQSLTLSEPISAQPNGIVLVFSLYTDGVAEDKSINSFFVSKKEVEMLPGAPHTFFMMINAGFSVIGAKYIYINDTILSGHESNNSDGTNNNLTFKNRRFVLRYVIGV